MNDELDTQPERTPRRPPAALTALYRALSKVRAQCDIVQQAEAERDGIAVERAAHEAVYRWLCARAILQRVAGLRAVDDDSYVDMARSSVDGASSALIAVLQRASRASASSALRRTLMQLRLSLVIANGVSLRDRRAIEAFSSNHPDPEPARNEQDTVRIKGSC
jgi:hypothetical protein